MSDELLIRKPFVETTADEVRLHALLVQDDQEYDAWYQVGKEYGEYLVDDRADAFVVNMLLYAMERGLDIVSEAPVTERLLYQLREVLIPSISSNVVCYKPISINAQATLLPLQNAGAVGTSLSGGVDSFYTVLRHLDPAEGSFRLTHLTFFNAGQSGQYGGDGARLQYRNRIRWIRGAAEELGLSLVEVDTNINEFLHQEHERTHTFRTLAIVHALGGLFSKYYFSSGVTYSRFAFAEFDTAMYDLLNVECLSSDSLTIYSDGGSCSRLGKLRYISDYPITYGSLNVCVVDDTNCSRCEKCKRTMTGLYAIDRLDRYAQVFDLDYFKKHKSDYLAEAVSRRRNYDWDEIYAALKKGGEIWLGIWGLAQMKRVHRQLWWLAHRRGTR